MRRPYDDALPDGSPIDHFSRAARFKGARLETPREIRDRSLVARDEMHFAGRRP